MCEWMCVDVVCGVCVCVCVDVCGVCGCGVCVCVVVGLNSQNILILIKNTFFSNRIERSFESSVL